MIHKFECNDDGLRVVTDYMPDIETVSISVLVKTGSRHEDIKVNGISHFLEHMAFKGTVSRSARQIAEEFDMIGGKFNAYTSRERTVYHAKVLKDDWYKAIEIIADILQNSIFDQKELDSERNVIIQEIAQTNDAPDDIIFDYFQEAAFPDQPIGRSILGTEEFIRNVQKDDFLIYMQERYRSNNVIVSASGNFDHVQFTSNALKEFHALPNGSNAEYVKAVYKGGERRIQRDLEQVHLVIGFPGFSYNDENYYSAQVLSMIAGGGMSSRLFQEIREKRGLAYHISSFSSSYADCGIFGVYSATSEDKVNELIDATANELYDLTNNIDAYEVQRAKAQLKASILMSMESSMARAEKIASNYAAFERFIPVEEIISKIDAVNIESMKKMMRSILSEKSALTFATIGKVDKVYPIDVIQNKFKI